MKTLLACARRLGPVLVLCCRAAQAGAGVTLEVQPASVDVSPWYQRVQARVVLRNEGQRELLKPALSAFTNDSFSATIEPSAFSKVRAGEAVAWTVWVEGVDRGRIPGTVQFEASYAVAGQPGAAAVFAPLALKLQAPADKPVEFFILGSFVGITEKRPGKGYLLARNNLDVPIRVSGVAILLPDAESFETPRAIGEFHVPPRSAVARKLELAAAAQVRPGKQGVAFQVTAEWDEGGQHQVRISSVEKEVEVGVFFESELLAALGVPSFLLLPGCLFLFTMQLLLSLGVLGLDRYSKLPDLGVTKPGFWILAVTFSGLFVLAHGRVTHRDYLTRYGARDLLEVWLASILLGVLAYVLVALLTLHRRRQRVPHTADSQIVTLEKMVRRGRGVMAGQVRFKLNNLELAAFLIEDIEDDQTLVWVVPRIQTTWDGTAEALGKQDEVTQLVDQRADLAKIAEALRDAHEKKLATIDWMRQGSVQNPYHLKVEGITQYDAPQAIVAIG